MVEGIYRDALGLLDYVPDQMEWFFSYLEIRAVGKPNYSVVAHPLHRCGNRQVYVNAARCGFVNRRKYPTFHLALRYAAGVRSYAVSETRAMG